MQFYNSRKVTRNGITINKGDGIRTFKEMKNDKKKIY